MGTPMVANDSCETDPDSVADVSQFTPGSAPIPCEPWDIGTGVTGYVWRALKPRAVLLLQHGYGDYAQSYVRRSNQLIPHLLNLGISVYAFDMWGSGRSPGPRGATDVNQAVEDHLAAQRKLAKQPLPVFLFGHSLGGLVVATSIIRDQGNLCGVILLSPALKYDVNAPIRFLAQVGGFLVPTFPSPIPAGKLSALTHDPKVMQLIANDPLMYLGRITWLTAAGGAKFSHDNWKFYPNVSVPVLAVHGTADKNTDPNGSQRLIEMIASEDKTLHLIDGGLHALLDDTSKDEVLDIILTWLDQRLSSNNS